MYEINEPGLYWCTQSCLLLAWLRITFKASNGWLDFFSRNIIMSSRWQWWYQDENFNRWKEIQRLKTLMTATNHPDITAEQHQEDKELSTYDLFEEINNTNWQKQLWSAAADLKACQESRNYNCSVDTSVALYWTKNTLVAMTTLMDVQHTRILADRA